MEAIVNSKPVGSETRRRWEVAIKQKAFNSIRKKIVLETSADDLLATVVAAHCPQIRFNQQKHLKSI